MSNDDFEEEEEAPPRRNKATKLSKAEAKAAAAKAAAQQQGYDAYGQGLLATDNPYKNDAVYPATMHSPWKYGWGLAKFEAVGAKGVPVYSHMPATYCMPAEAYAHYAKANYRPRGQLILDARETAPLLPWTMEQLPETRWVNVHTRGLITIGAIAVSRWGEPVAPYGNGTQVPRPADDHGITLGLWWSDHYVIEHWMRCDHWAPAEYMVWLGSRLEHIRKDSSMSPDWNKREERETLAELVQYAALHRLVVTTELINSGRGQRADGKPEQLTLF